MTDDLEALASMIDGLGLEDIQQEDLTTLNNAELLTRWNQLSRQLLVSGELLHPTTQEGRDLHSHHGAVKVELIRRGLM